MMYSMVTTALRHWMRLVKTVLLCSASSTRPTAVDPPQGVVAIGEWLFHNGSSVDSDGFGDDIYRGRNPSYVALYYYIYFTRIILKLLGYLPLCGT